MNIDKAAEARGIKTFDTALPQGWWDRFYQETGENPCGHFVWSYDKATWLGAPEPVTEHGDALLAAHPDLARL